MRAVHRAVRLAGELTAVVDPGPHVLPEQLVECARAYFLGRAPRGDTSHAATSSPSAGRCTAKRSRAASHDHSAGNALPTAPRLPPPRLFRLARLAPTPLLSPPVSTHDRVRRRVPMTVSAVRLELHRTRLTFNPQPLRRPTHPRIAQDF